jgi:iron complex outermembrane receptor protein
MKTALNLSASTCALLALAGSLPALAQESRGPAEAIEQRGEEPGAIVVSARRREESIQDVPIAISAIGDEELSRRRIRSLNDLAAAIPGFSISNNSNGRSDRSFQQISLRGFTPSTAGITTTATFIDGVPVASASAVNAVVDPARIEVLKGPQPAYYGRNTFAGAVNVVNKAPSFEWGGSVAAEVATRDGYDLTGAIEGPIIPDLLAFRVTGRAYGTNGSYDNPAAPGQTLGDQSTKTATLSLLATPGGGVTLKAFGMYSRDRDGPSAQGFMSAYEVRAGRGSTLPTTAAPGAVNIPAMGGVAGAGALVLPGYGNCTLNGFTNGFSASEPTVARQFMCGKVGALDRAYSPAQNTVEDAYITNYLANPNGRLIAPSDAIDGYGLIRRYTHLHFNADWEIVDTGFTLSSLTGYNHEEYFQLADLDNYDGRLLANPTYTPTNGQRAYFDFPYEVDRMQKDFSQEVRLAYDDRGPLRAMIGGSYLWYNSQNSGGGGNGALGSGAPGTLSTISPATGSKTYSVFGSVGFDVTSQFNINLEARYQIDHLFAYAGPTGTTIPASTFLPAGTYAPNAVLADSKYKNFLPRMIAQYKFTPELMAYASYSKGVNSGVFNVLFLNRSETVQNAVADAGVEVGVSPEKLDNYEVGIKGELFDRKLSFALAAFYGDWTNQINLRTVSVLDVPSPPGTGTVTPVIGQVNSGSTKVKGLELDVHVTPVTGLDLSFGGAITDASIRSFSDPAVSKLTGVIGDEFRGNQLPNMSKYSASIGAQYSGTFGSDGDIGWYLRGDMIYQSRIFATASNVTWIGAQTPVNFKAGISNGPNTFEAFVRNAFNNRSYTSIAEQTVLVPGFALSGANSALVLGMPTLRTAGIAYKRTF